MEFPELQSIHERLADAGKPDEPIPSQRRARGHSQGGQYFWIGSQTIGCDHREVPGEYKGLLNLLGGFDSRVSVSFGSELHKPSVEKIHRSPNVIQPKVWLVGIDCH
jgi:hypothetical protein